MTNIKEIFGSMVFNDAAMKAYMPQEVYSAFQKTIAEDKSLDINLANEVALAMKTWAVVKGATHFTHWFQPMTGITAEKHDSFIVPTEGGGVELEFSGKELIKGESDASSFPSGGLRATFEARGYTAWDPTSYAFIKDKTLYIPTAFCSYNGDSLDKKTPLLRSMDAINEQALRILRLFGNEGVNKVFTTVGPEQEYFLIDKDVWQKRPDLIYTGRTLFGAKPPKGQELEDHYFGSIKPRVQLFMNELNEELWKLGVYAKTQHNETAPAQHELATVYTTTNVAADHNQLTMEVMKKIAARYNLVCLMHEKPFAGVNGSGKHNNWSLSTDTGVNLLEPGKSPSENAQFLLFLTAIIKAVDDYQDLLRVSVASAGNDHRLGANEAPPAIISIFLGEELTDILDSIEKGCLYNKKAKCSMDIGVHVLPKFPKDTTDRNRTSPFAFTGNKFEFRMLGSAFSISDSNMILNTIAAEVFKQFADILENASDFNAELNKLVAKTIKEHKRIIFNGNNYSEEWINEAEKRGLLNMKSTPDALPSLIAPKNIEVLTKHKVLTVSEINSRYEVFLESYAKLLNIEANTMIEILKRSITPAVIAYTQRVLKEADLKRSFPGATLESETALIKKLSELGDSLFKKTEALEKIMITAKEQSGGLETAKYYRNTVFAAMQELRAVADELETIVGKDYWPLPSYGDILFSVY